MLHLDNLNIELASISYQLEMSLSLIMIKLKITKHIYVSLFANIQKLSPYETEIRSVRIFGERHRWLKFKSERCEKHNFCSNYGTAWAYKIMLMNQK